jgi:lipopolysaccharide export LptBFGC system permease protein LptF
VGHYLSPALAAWLPNIVCGGLGLALLVRQR